MCLPEGRSKEGELRKGSKDNKPENRLLWRPVETKNERLEKAKDERPRKEKPREGKPKSKRLIESSMERSKEKLRKRLADERARRRSKEGITCSLASYESKSNCWLNLEEKLKEARPKKAKEERPGKT